MFVKYIHFFKFFCFFNKFNDKFILLKDIKHRSIRIRSYTCKFQFLAEGTQLKQRGTESKQR